MSFFRTGLEAKIGLICATCGLAVAPGWAVAGVVSIAFAKWTDHVLSGQDPLREGKNELTKAIGKALTQKRIDFVAAYQHIPTIEHDLDQVQACLLEVLPHASIRRETITKDAFRAGGFIEARVDDILIELNLAYQTSFKADNIIATDQQSKPGYQFIKQSLIAGFETAILDDKNYAKIDPYIQLEQAKSLGMILDQIGGLKDDVAEVGGKADELKDGQEEIKALIRQTMAEKHIMPPEELRSPDFFVKLSNAHDAPINELLGLVSDVLKKDVNPQNFGQMLDLAKKALVVVKTEFQNISHLSNEVPEIKPFLDNARAALEDDSAIDLEEAKTELRAARGEYEARVEKRHNEEKQNSAEMIVLEAQIAQAQSNIDEAAALYDEAIAKVAHHLELMQGYLWDKASMLYQAGILSAEPDWLRNAIKTRRDLLKTSDRQNNADYWAKVSGNLGNALSQLGSRQSDDELLKEAIDAYRAALRERTRERVPLDWATTQNNLGAALRQLGSRQSDDGLLQEAIDAYRAALQERTRERVPLDWATTQNNLGNALRELGSRQSEDGLLKEAIDAYRAALQEWTRERVPLDWAMTQNNLGNALGDLGLRQSDEGLLKEAIGAYREALQERTRERVPLDWAATQNNLGNALQGLGLRQSDDGLLREAIDALRAALQEWTRERVPLDWAGTQYNLGTVLGDLAELTEDEDLFLQAIQAYELALEERREDNAPHYHQQTKDNLAITESKLAELRAKKHGAG